jgi:DNA-binding transcriptional MerR regulator
MTLEEIRNLLRFRDRPNDNCSQVDALLDEHIEHVATRIKELKLLQNKLTRAAEPMPASKSHQRL